VRPYRRGVRGSHLGSKGVSEEISDALAECLAEVPGFALYAPPRHPAVEAAPKRQTGKQ